MGKKMGLSPLETLAAIYVGLQLFGLFGFLLGPIGLLIIKDFVEEYGVEDEGSGVYMYVFLEGGRGKKWSIGGWTT